jgi:hypothetical protein
MNDAAWSYGAVLSPVEAKEYLLKDPRMGVHVRAFLKVCAPPAGESVACAPCLRQEVDRCCPPPAPDPLPRTPDPYSQSVLQPQDLPSERLGYTYIMCPAGGELNFDGFANAESSLTIKQGLTPDLRQLTRAFM